MVSLVPLPVIVPLAAAALLAAIGKRVPRGVSDALAIGAALAVTLVAGALLHAVRLSPLTYWFGGWTPRAGVSLGVAFMVDPLGAGLAATSGLLVTASLVFTQRWYETNEAHFHVLMLVFLAALCGFALTYDLFDLFVFFELMSTAAFALCGYKSREEGPLQGAINFGVTNTIGALLVLVGVGLLYGRTGALNLAQIGRALGSRPDPLVLAAFTVTTCGFLVKTAVVPLHFWLADAHAVAPTPACVVFSGVMVEAGLYAVLRLWGAVFHGPLAASEPGVRAVLAAVGVATAVVGALQCFAQRHLKRLLAFSTIAHVGILVLAASVLDATALGGVAVYVAGHAGVKGALFLTSGVILHRLGSVDEIRLRGRGGVAPGVGVLLGVGALGLAGVMPFGTFLGEASIDEALKRAHMGWGSWVIAFTAIVTAGSVLRATFRIFLGWGTGEPEAPDVGGEHDEPKETTPGRGVPPTMIGPIVALLAFGLTCGLAPHVTHAARAAAAALLDTAGQARWVLDGGAVPAGLVPPDEALGPAVVRSSLLAAGAVAFALATLFRTRIPDALVSPIARPMRPLLRGLRELHSGHVGDYVAWMSAFVALFGAACALFAGR